MTYLFPAGGQRGTTVEVTAAGTFERWPVQGWASEHAVTVKAAKDKGKLTVAIAADAVPGTCWIRLHDDQGASTLRPFLVGTLPEFLEQEPNDEPKKPQQLSASSVVVNGRLDRAGDVDGFAVPLRKGQTLVAALDAHAALRSPMDAVMQVVSPAGFVLEQNHDTIGLDPRIVFPVPEAGTYLVRVFAFPATPDSGIRFAGAETFVYRLTLTTSGFVDHAFPLAVAHSAPGEVELAGWGIPPSARMVSVTPSPADDVTVFHAELAGVGRVRLEAHPCTVKPPDPEGRTPFRFTLPATVSGRLERPRAVDLYEFAAKKGQRVSFQVESRTLGFPLTARLRLTDGSEKELARAEANKIDGDPELSFVPPQDGTYRLTVRDAYGGGGLRFVYRLRALAAAPDFALTLKTDRLTLTAGQPLDVPVTIERRQGFKDDVELVVEGLPPGVTAATPAAGKLQLSAPAGTNASASIRIVARSRTAPILTRPATVLLSDFGQTTSGIWLTVSPAPAKPASAKE